MRENTTVTPRMVRQAVSIYQHGFIKDDLNRYDAMKQALEEFVKQADIELAIAKDEINRLRLLALRYSEHAVALVKLGYEDEFPGTAEQFADEKLTEIEEAFGFIEAIRDEFEFGFGEGHKLDDMLRLIKARNSIFNKLSASEIAKIDDEVNS